MKPELYEEVQLICSVPSAELEVGDFSESLRSNRAVVIDYLEHPESGETGAVLELSQSLEREQYVVTVPVGAIASKACLAVATSNQEAHAIARQQEASANRPFWSSVLQRVLGIFAKFMAFLSLGKREN